MSSTLSDPRGFGQKPAAPRELLDGAARGRGLRLRSISNSRDTRRGQNASAGHRPRRSRLTPRYLRISMGGDCWWRRRWNQPNRRGLRSARRRRRFSAWRSSSAAGVLGRGARRLERSDKIV